MNILVTGAKGFVGKNLCALLRTIAEGKNRSYGKIAIDNIFEYDIDSTPEELDEYCQKADFVFNLAGVNRPQSAEEFMQGNFGFASTLLEGLKRHNNTCPVMISSSIQATCIGRYDSDYLVEFDFLNRYSIDFYSVNFNSFYSIRNFSFSLLSESLK